MRDRQIEGQRDRQSETDIQAETEKGASDTT